MYLHQNHEYPLISRFSIEIKVFHETIDCYRNQQCQQKSWDPSKVMDPHQNIGQPPKSWNSTRIMDSQNNHVSPPKARNPMQSMDFDNDLGPPTKLPIPGKVMDCLRSHRFHKIRISSQIMGFNEKYPPWAHTTPIHREERSSCPVGAFEVRRKHSYTGIHDHPRAVGS